MKASAVFTFVAASASAALAASTPRLAQRGNGLATFMSKDTHTYAKADPSESTMRIAAVDEMGGDPNKITTACLPVNAGATPADCEKLISELRGLNKNGTEGPLDVPAGMCANWQAGTCLAQVCARDADYSEQPGAVADRFAGEPMTCIRSQESAVVSDCPDYGNACGSYRYWLIAPPNAWNGGAQQDEAREADRAAASGSNDANGGKARQ